MRILGIDPGLNTTGYGIIDVKANDLNAVTAGDIKTPGRASVSKRLETIHLKLIDIMNQFHPNLAVLEMVFTHKKYPSTASLMSHARGVACLVVQESRIELKEYPPAQIKKALTGSGAASKDQVARMVMHWLGISEMSYSRDATDALALAIAHAHFARQEAKLPIGTASK